VISGAMEARRRLAWRQRRCPTLPNLASGLRNKLTNGLRILFID
jgi:hypothetical protein